MMRWIVILAVPAFASACGGNSSGWKCDKDNTFGISSARNADTGELISCSGSWGCEDHSYKLACERSNDSWNCSCEKDGFPQASFINADICDIAARTPTDDFDVPDIDKQVRTRINTGCTWDLPLEH